MHSQYPYTRDLVLVGGGHTHALVLKAWAMKPLHGARLTLVNPEPQAIYTGMLPGFIAGHYERNELEIDLARLARSCGARLVLGMATGIDACSQTVSVGGRADIPFDVASLDIGIQAASERIPGSDRHATAIKPMSRFADSWEGFIADAEAGIKPASAVVIGAGVGGVELALAIAHRLKSCRIPSSAVSLVESDERILSELPRRAAAKLLRKLRESGVSLECPAKAVEISEGRVLLSDGRAIQSGFTALAAGGRPAEWLTNSGLEVEGGFVAVDECLRASGAEGVFASGDCAHFSASPLPKAGVYAVRQAPVLRHNLAAALSGGKFLKYRPQRDFLKLISMGEESAIAAKRGVSTGGAWAWRLKDRIDRRFMRRLKELPAMPRPSAPDRSAAGLKEMLEGEAMLCGGCGSKAGPASLKSGLSAQTTCRRNDVVLGIGDDAAVLQLGGHLQVIATDHMRAFIEDHWLFARIAALHSLGDIWAMGARPQAALASLILPRMPERMLARTLREIMHAATQVFREEGAEIVGGHTSQGAELVVGFTVTGTRERPAIAKSGARPGDKLLATRAIGTGTVLAGDMSGAATGRELESALVSMSRSSGRAAEILAGSATAMTDVSGFGIAGHLMEMLEASDVSARIELDRIQVLPGAERLASEGIRSTIWSENSRISDRMELPAGARAGLLFDPQTAGGLLAAVPEDSLEPTLARLRGAGEPASCIGEIRGGGPRIVVE